MKWKPTLALLQFSLLSILKRMPGFNTLFQSEVTVKTGDIFPLGRLLGEKGPLVLDSSKYTVVYFYPKDETPGCTIEAAEFEKLKPEFQQAGIRIVGASVDDATSHRQFCGKMGLTFELATDPEGRLGRDIGILSGSLHQRVTYVLDNQGQVVLHYPAVKASGHAQAVLQDIGGLTAP